MADYGLHAPLIFLNWQAQRDGKPRLSGFEFELFSDCAIDDAEVSLGPYFLAPLLPVGRRGGILKPIIVVRVDQYLDPDDDWEEMTKTYVLAYHGGSLEDEVASLVSLALGARIRPGSVTRHFDRWSGPEGRPVNEGPESQPVLPPRATSNPIIPESVREKSLKECSRLPGLIDVKADAAHRVIKAARLYQQAMWLSDTDAALTWLLMVSAVEAAAKEAFPRLGSKARFVEFLLSHVPDPPERRPGEEDQLTFDVSALEIAFQSIYKHRCNALHEGIPFPAPMCIPTLPLNPYGVPAEVLTGSAWSSGGGTWLKTDLPATLHVFAHIVRGAMWKWIHGLSRDM